MKVKSKAPPVGAGEASESDLRMGKIKAKSNRVDLTDQAQNRGRQ
jgi:hypothetical protein